MPSQDQKDQKQEQVALPTMPATNMTVSPLTELLPHPCPVCSSMGKKLKDGMCKGHGGGGGGSGGGSGKGEEKREALQLKPQQGNNNQKPNTEFDAIKSVAELYNEIAKALLNETNTLFEIGALLVKVDSLKGNLMIEMRQDLSTADRETVLKFLEKINNAFLEFRKDRANEGVAVVNFTSKLDPTQGLAIHMPSKYFNKFIAHLMSQNLLPVPSNVDGLKPVDNAAEEAVEKKKQPGYLNPFKMDLTPPGSDV